MVGAISTDFPPVIVRSNSRVIFQMVHAGDTVSTSK